MEGVVRIRKLGSARQGLNAQSEAYLDGAITM